MKESSIEKDEEILNNIKAYMQENIDKGYHKFVYNDLGYDEKCVDVINAIEHILSDYKRVLKENEELKRKNKTLEELLQGNLYELYKYYKELAGTYQGNCISKEKIKNKIEYLKDYIEENSDEQGYWGNINSDIIYGKIEILEESLEESED